MKTIEKLIRLHIQGKKVLFMFILTTIVYLVMVLLTIPKVMVHGNGMQLLDMMPMGYDLEYVTKLFDALGAEGRQAYRYRQLPLDMIYPSLFAICYCLVMGFFLNKLDKLNKPLLYLCLLPFFIGAMDYAENIGIIVMLNDYPEVYISTVTGASVFSLLKSMGTTLYFVILIIVLVIVGIKILRK